MDKKSATPQPFRFTWMEFSGSLGDLGLFIPLVAAMTLTCDLDIGIVLIMAGFMNILTGWLFRQPIPVQPMKAIAAVVITEHMVREEMIAAGILMGIILLLGSVVSNRFSEIIPKPIVRGIQLGIGLKLALTGAQWTSRLPLAGWNGLWVAALVIIVLFGSKNIKQPVLLYLFFAGIVFLYVYSPGLFNMTPVSWPHLELTIPSLFAWSGGFVKGVLPQMPLTLLNSVVAVCALSAQYFPGRGAQPKTMAASVGIMNLISVPLGGVPMCHGAGGLAAQYRFGARTGGSVIMLGTLKVIIGIVFGAAFLSILQNYPMSILGPMLIFAGIELAGSARDLRGETRAIIVALVTAVVILLINTWAGFLAGIIASFIWFNHFYRKTGHGQEQKNRRHGRYQRKGCHQARCPGAVNYKIQQKGV